MSFVLKINDLINGEIIKRPSKYIKTPYVADIKISSNNETALGHSASLGCSGLSEVGCNVLVGPIKNKDKNKDKLHCKYRIYLSIIKERNEEIIVGIYPKLAEYLTESALKNNLLSKLMNIKKYNKETHIYIPNVINSRFDFTGIDKDNNPFIMEVKNVPLADYEDVTSKDRKKMCFDNRCINSKVAYFPDGYRKKITDTISPRALKHINELTIIRKNSNIRCIMCYVIQRTDVNRFQPSIIDPEYRDAFKKALETGVEIITMVVKWNNKGEAYFIKDDLFINI